MRVEEKIHARKRNPNESHFIFLLSSFFADRATPKVLEIRRRDSHGAGGAKTGGGRKGGAARAISTESRDLRQIIAERKSWESESNHSLECEDGLSWVA